MLSKRSIRDRFIVQLVLTSSILIGLFSLIFYGYIKNQIYSDIEDELLFSSKSLINSNSEYRVGTKFSTCKLAEIENSKIINISIEKLNSKIESYKFQRLKLKDREILKLTHPYNLEKSSYIVINRDITGIEKLLSKILNSLIVLNSIGLFFIIIYGFIASKFMLKYIQNLTLKLTKRDENYLEHIDSQNFPIEFIDLAESINRLIDKIKLFITYKKELFTGAAHELKTPLAVMKLKNEVTLLKNRDIESYQKVLNLNISEINRMDKMVQNLLQIARQEGAQFEEPMEVNIVEFLNKKVKDLNPIIQQKSQNISIESELKEILLFTQPTLFSNIVENLILNSLKFSQKNSTISIKINSKNHCLILEIIDSGDGLDETLDLFAPFKRSKNSDGLGLGLFLAKRASDAIGAKLYLKNRVDSKGSIASLEIYLNKI